MTERAAKRRSQNLAVLALPTIAETLEPVDPRAVSAVVLAEAHVALYRPPRHRAPPQRLVTPMDLAMAIAHRVPAPLAFSAPAPRPVRPVEIARLPSDSDCEEQAAAALASAARKEAWRHREELQNLPDASAVAEVNTFETVDDIPLADTEDESP
ncbi:hypothetical protein PsYK624_016450 [Phanerochaete sordida]|uniref:Uncharacterized protein n=1 Tax=Phanerochaete sordida TaxID=48140 RepID=A0A9P3FZP3_9APHY|nr:hypothetical protein PsYK624_016450 [Phanerochaete sordida]